MSALRRDAGLLVLALVSVFVVTYEFAFVHEPRFATSLLIYAIDAVFLVTIAMRWRSRRMDGGGGSGEDAPLARTDIALIAGSLPIDALFLVGDAAPLGISVVLWLRLLRLLRMPAVMAVLGRAEHLATTSTATIRIIRLVVIIAVTLQVLACLWFLIPFGQGTPADSWAAINGLQTTAPVDAYVLSFYWVVTTMTSVGFGDIVPLRTEEYVFVIGVMLAGASLFAYAIATGASLIQNLDLSRARFWNRVETVESYLRSRDVSEDVSTDVRHYYEYMWERHRGTGERELFAELPRSLRLAVIDDLTHDLRAQVPIFRAAPSTLRDELIISLEPLVFPPGSSIVRDGEVGDGIYFIAAGAAEVTGDGVETKQTELGPGDYFGDLTLMLGERRSASVVARDYVEVFRLSGADFDRIREAFPEFRDVMRTASEKKSGRMADLVVDGIVL